MSYYLSFDIGGTAVKYGCINESGIITECSETATQGEKGSAFLVDKIKTLIDGYCQKEMPLGICISTPGIVDADNGAMVCDTPAIKNYKGTQWKAEIEKQFKIRCEVENDANCAGLAEYVSGAARGCSSSLLLTIGTNVGGCFVYDGKVLRGASNSALEVGYMKIGDEDFQDVASTRALIERTAKRKGIEADLLDGRIIKEAAENGDEDCILELDRMAQFISAGAADLCFILNPEIVVIGGGIMTGNDKMLEMIKEKTLARMGGFTDSDTRFAIAVHGNTAGMLGAYYNFLAKR